MTWGMKASYFPVSRELPTLDLSGTDEILSASEPYHLIVHMECQYVLILVFAYRGAYDKQPRLGLEDKSSRHS